ncbi:MAG: hypothetical protein ACLFTK_04465 [Anaerolineales bacterium]
MLGQLFDTPDPNIAKLIEACRMLMRRMSDANLQPLEREAGYVLGLAVRAKAEEMGLLDNPEVREFLRMHDAQRSEIRVRRYPQDFPEGEF